jgi:hypothetical protein
LHQDNTHINTTGAGASAAVNHIENHLNTNNITKNHTKNNFKTNHNHHTNNNDIEVLADEEDEEFEQDFVLYTIDNYVKDKRHKKFS